MGEAAEHLNLGDSFDFERALKLQPELYQEQPDSFLGPVTLEAGDLPAKYHLLSKEVVKDLNPSPINLRAGEQKQRSDTLQMIVMRLGMLPITPDDQKNKKNTTQFYESYKAADQTLRNLDEYDELDDLLTDYESHPVLQVLDLSSQLDDRLSSSLNAIRNIAVIMFNEEGVSSQNPYGNT